MKKAKVIVVLGPTSGGKTALSIELAKMYNGEVVSADSRQVYTGLDLGTGKVTKKEMAGIRHHLLDVANPKKIFSVGDYAPLAHRTIEEIIARGKTPILCGGTGFYIDTVANGTTLPNVPPNTKLRKQLESQSITTLVKQLEKLDPARAKTIDKNNPVRLVRAIEIAKALGKVPALKNEAQYDVLKIGLDMPDKTLRSRIVERLSMRVRDGMLKEARALHASGLSWQRMITLGLEYRHMALLLTKKTRPEDFEKELSEDIWRYAKRQRTWFKKDKTIRWFNPMLKSSFPKIKKLVSDFLRKKS